LLELKIPPPIVGLIMGLLAFLSTSVSPAVRIESFLLEKLAVLFLIIGVFIELWSVGLFIKARTTVNPIKPASSTKLVVTGMYRLTRNPMYLGMLLLLIGWVFWLGNLIGLLMPVIFVWYITRFQIKPEEDALVKLFGEQFIDYQTKVRRWL